MEAKFKRTVFLLISFGYKYSDTVSHLSFLTQVNELKKKNHLSVSYKYPIIDRIQHNFFFCT